jgi:DNA modification methylase
MTRPVEWLNRCHFGDCLEVLRTMPDGIVNTCVTSPPYFGLRDYGHAGQIGLEATPDEFIAKLVAVFREVRRVLRDDGTLWCNLGDSYAANRTYQVHNTKGAAEHTYGKGSKVPEGIKPKDLIGVPWMLAFALRADGWYLRQDIIWAKPNPMPESVTDRCTKSHEYIFMLSKAARYYYDGGAIKEPAIYAGIAGMDESGYKDAQAFAGKHAKEDKQRGHLRRHAGFNERWDAMSREEQCSGMRNKRSVWNVATKPYKGAHFATFPTNLIEPCILAGAPAGGVVLDPFFGSGTTGQVAQSLGRKYIGIELNRDYEPLQAERLRQPSLELEDACL